jgi:hypothetical protein
MAPARLVAVPPNEKLPCRATLRVRSAPALRRSFSYGPLSAEVRKKMCLIELDLPPDVAVAGRIRHATHTIATGRPCSPVFHRRGTTIGCRRTRLRHLRLDAERLRDAIGALLTDKRDCSLSSSWFSVATRSPAIRNTNSSVRDGWIIPCRKSRPYGPAWIFCPSLPEPPFAPD